MPKSIVIPLFSNLWSSVSSCFGIYMFNSYECNWKNSHFTWLLVVLTPVKHSLTDHNLVLEPSENLSGPEKHSMAD